VPGSHGGNLGGARGATKARVILGRSLRPGWWRQVNSRRMLNSNVVNLMDALQIYFFLTADRRVAFEQARAAAAVRFAARLDAESFGTACFAAA
jgi:hypothetical protein